LAAAVSPCSASARLWAASLAGIAIGAIIGQSSGRCEAWTPSPGAAYRAAARWLPIALAASATAAFGVFVIFITAIWPIIINTAVGIRNIPDDYRNVAQVLQLNPWNSLASHVARRSAYIFTGLRIGIGLAGRHCRRRDAPAASA